jgi:hypothetical protein
MDERGPTISLRTKPAQLDKKRFDLEWHLPLEPGLPMHAALFDFQGPFPEQVAEAEGGDEAETLLTLWTTLLERQASTDAHAGGIHQRLATHDDRVWPRPLPR